MHGATVGKKVFTISNNTTVQRSQLIMLHPYNTYAPRSLPFMSHHSMAGENPHNDKYAKHVRWRNDDMGGPGNVKDEIRYRNKLLLFLLLNAYVVTMPTSTAQQNILH
jgi:hypothetical protein